MYKSKQAQAMVEFMLALPVLIVLLYGILEVSRLIFIFASVSNASRQAARYGAGTGEINKDFTYFQDCEGIRDVANQSAILAEFDEINITYDRGVTSDGGQIPIPNIDPDPDMDTCPIGDGIIRNGDRIIVQVSVSYEPIIPFANIEPLEVVSANARTFLVSVPIFGSAFPTGFKAETATPSKAATRTLAASNTPEPTINATYAAIRTLFPRTPTSTLPPTLTLTPSFTPTATLPPSATATPINCTGNFAVNHGPLSFENNMMSMSLENNTGHTLTTASIYIEWNHDTGSDSRLSLSKIRLDNQEWTGNIYAPSTFVSAFYPYIPPGNSQVEFYFSNRYLLQDGTERIIITIGNPGCTLYPIDSRN